MRNTSFIIAPLLLSLISCQKKKSINFTKIKIGESLVHSLEGNPSTGYSWQYEVSNPDIVAISAEMIDENKDMLVVGAPVKMNFAITGKKKGETILIFLYKRTWDKDVAPLKSDTLAIKVG